MFHCKSTAQNLSTLLGIKIDQNKATGCLTLLEKIGYKAGKLSLAKGKKKQLLTFIECFVQNAFCTRLAKKEL